VSNTKILAIGEAYGRQEDLIRRPFVGAAGNMLNRLLEDTEILPLGSARQIRPRYIQHPSPSDLIAEAERRDVIYTRSGIHLTNVFKLRPEGNKIENLCGPRWGDLPPIRAGKYLRQEFIPHLDAVRRSIEQHQPNLILGLGATAAWFILGSGYISKVRGAIAASPYGKFLPTFHPASLLQGRSPENRPIVLMDLMKARREMEFPEVRRPRRFVYVPEHLHDIESVLPYLRAARCIAIDIETVENQITSISFAWAIDHALTIPIFDWRRESRSYWSLEDELVVWRMIRYICGLPNPKLFQNGLFDMRFLYESYHISVANVEHDTMLLHHALQPEMLKGLGFLGSIYTNEASWKLMRTRVNKTIKREDE
jgi:uracil-DNA glycosylase